MAVDATISRMVGLDIDKVPYFKPASKRGIGRYQEEDIDIRGNKIEDVFKKLWLPYLEGFDTWPEYDVHTENACSSLPGVISLYLWKTSRPLVNTIITPESAWVMGARKSLPEGIKPENLIIIGDCLKKYWGKGKGVCVWGMPAG